MGLRIEDYALLGDCQTAALVGLNGSIDWLCLPRFDSPACFAALLGGPEHGRWQIAPAEPVLRRSRAYRGDTLVLDTTWETAGGVVTLTDCMPIRSGQPDLVRLVRGIRGSVPMRLEWIVRFDTGNIVPWVKRERGGVTAIAGPEQVHLHTPIELRGEGWTTVGEFTVHPGEEVPFSLAWHPSHQEPDPPVQPATGIRSTIRWWRDWSRRCTYRGEWKSAVMRSLITLKALTYLPTGGIVAAPTTSLPEQLGGARNWDYRYCWLRDASFTLSALLQCGYQEEAAAWRQWLLRAVAGRGSELQIMYGVAGERRLTEMELPWLPGYESSKPVRVGNAASQQFQLDVYGEVLETLHLARGQGLHDCPGDPHVERELLDYLSGVWTRPDEGIWEIRGPRRHFTHSKLMAWLAFDRAIKDSARYGLKGPADSWRALRDEIHAEICDRAFNRRLGTFTQSYDSDEVDAALLLMAEHGFLPADDPRIVGTVSAIERELMRDGFVHRYRSGSGVDGLPEGEGAFLLCTSWLVDNYALMGRIGEARELFQRLLAIRNDVGLLSEVFDPVTRRQLGNFPQAFSHLGLINNARRLDEVNRRLGGAS